MNAQQFSFDFDTPVVQQVAEFYMGVKIEIIESVSAKEAIARVKASEAARKKPVSDIALSELDDI